MPLIAGTGLNGGVVNNDWGYRPGQIVVVGGGLASQIENQMRKLRIVLGALIAPASAPLLYFVSISIGSGYPESDPGHPGKLIDELLLALLPMSFALSLVIGAPALLVLSRLNRLSLWQCVGFAAVIGAALGIIGTYVFGGPPGSSAHVASRAAVAILGLIASSVIALAFCLIAGMPMRAKSAGREACF